MIRCFAPLLALGRNAPTNSFLEQVIRELCRDRSLTFPQTIKRGRTEFSAASLQFLEESFRVTDWSLVPLTLRLALRLNRR
jgi:hypothetical protein